MTGIFIVARLGSTRLSQKHLVNAGGKTFIEWLAARFLEQFAPEVEQGLVRLCIVTSELDFVNKKFEQLFSGNEKVSVFFGSDTNIPLRELQCATTYNCENIVSIDGDDILCSPHAARLVLDKLIAGYNYVGTTGLPLGMNVSGFKTKFLKDSLNNSEHKKLETGWGRIFEGEPQQKIFLQGDSPALRFTLDYAEDAAFFKAMIEGIGEDILTISDDQIIDYARSAELYKLNAKLNDEYWANFAAQKQKEQQ